MRAKYIDMDQWVTIANTEGVFARDHRMKTRLHLTAYAEADGECQTRDVYKRQVERGGKWHIAGNCYDEKDRHSEQVVGTCREVVEKSSEDEYH